MILTRSVLKTPEAETIRQKANHKMATNKEILAQLAALTALVTKQNDEIARLKTKGRKAAMVHEPKRPEGLPVEPSSFSFNGMFGCYVPDGYNGVNASKEPEGLIVVNRRDREAEKGADGNFPVTETRYYVPTRGWKRSKKGNGWTTTFPKKATEDQIAEYEASAIEDGIDADLLKAL